MSSKLLQTSCRSKVLTTPRRIAATQPIVSQSRQLSTETPSSTTPTNHLHAPPEKGAQGPSKLPWPEYFRVRKSKRTWEMATTIPMSILGLGAGGGYFGGLEATGPIFTFDPIIVYGAATAGCMGLGWLLGPFIGGGLWRLSHRKALASIEERDVEFYHHLVKNRADATKQSVQNPVPDYYGEKIGSLTDYRRWLRDQGKFNRKTSHIEK
ncbi:TIM23 complex component [Tulasnella sp. JGI-2019a]|nr:TIM23 complex component [Tulasnella sp. JGI-2019a]KAG9013049.1 TIM23 complex component [Tulasnella sp. JGI-2019a]KAG9027367.1 TIM23 complex component [Tulasnella sp. JGI-2019a]